MKTQKPYDDDGCSDDDIFLSPAKRDKISLQCSEELTIPVQGGINEERVRRIKTCLIGIPRPPVESGAINFAMEDVKLFLNSSKSKVSSESSNLIQYNNVGHNKFGIYLNVDHSCEELERLAALFIEKYVPCETMSSLSDPSSYRRLTASAKKRRRCNGWASSPGSRLSYLARRKSTFSVDQVSKMGQPATSKQFLIHREHSCKSVKSVPSKPKRALFQSPDEAKNHNPFRTPDIDERKRRIRRLSVPNSTRILQRQSPKENKKQRTCRKSLEFVGESEVKLDTHCNNESSDKRVRRKLLWAVSTALKSVSVTSSHSKFKLCMNKLFKASLPVWTAKQDKKSYQENSCSTSEAMLILAKSLLQDVVLPELEYAKVKHDVESESTVYSPLDTIKCQDENSSQNCMECKGEVAIPLRTLTELTNSYISPTNKHTEEPSAVMVETKYELSSLQPNSLFPPPISETEKKKLVVCMNAKAEYRTSNHKRRREEDLEEEREGISSKTAKRKCTYRNGLFSTC